MIGQTIEARTSVSWGAMFFFLCGAAALALGVVTGSQEWFIVATLPLLLGCALWWARDPAFVAEFTATALETSSPPVSVLYTDIEGIKSPGRPTDLSKPGPQSYPIRILHREGVLHVPKKLNVPSDRVLHFLYAQLSPGGSRAVNPSLADYLRRQEETFGADRVWSFRGRQHLGRGLARRRPVVVCLALALCGVAWIVAGALDPKAPYWLVFGILAVIFGLLFALAFWYESPQLGLGRAYKHWRDASLVISPVGLALVQGDLRGEMRWDELRDVRLHGKARNFRIGYEHALPGIQLVVEGVSVLILDIYDRPLPMIFARIEEYWR